MKKIILSMLAATVLCTACSDDKTLEDSRTPDRVQPAISLEQVTVQKYDASFVINVSEFGDPSVLETGLLVSTQSEPTAENSQVIATDTVIATSKITETFSPSTTYYVRAYALTSNNIFYTEIKSFTTEDHPLSAYIGKKTLTAYEYNTEGDVTANITLSPDTEDESVLYLSGLGSYAGVELALADIKMVFDKDAGTVTIPAGQKVAEKSYGTYQYANIDPVTGNFLLKDDIVGICKDGVISIDCLVAVIIEGQNAGLPHLFMEGIEIGTK